MFQFGLQVQLNLAKRAIARLQNVLGIPAATLSTCGGGAAVNFDAAQFNVSSALMKASVDKLRVLIEFLLDAVLSMTNLSPTIPQIPLALYATFQPSFAKALFRNLCIHGTKKMQTHTGVILVRICGSQPWWGDFLGNILKEFFTSDQTAIFPQDRQVITRWPTCSRGTGQVFKSFDEME